MKRLVLLFIGIILLFGACKASKPSAEKEVTQTTVRTTMWKTNAMTEITQTTVRTTIWKTNPDTGLQEYVPGNVILNPIHDYSGACEGPAEKLAFRRIYYTISDIFWDYYGDEAVKELADEYSEKTEEIEEEMQILILIKHFNMPKKTFIELVEEERKLNASLASKGIDIDSEEFELYNADIIYTFDNDIINEYYRRE